MKKYRKSLYLEKINKFYDHVLFFHREKKGGGGRDFVHKLIHASTGNHCHSEGTVSLHATVQSESSYLKILKV